MFGGIAIEGTGKVYYKSTLNGTTFLCYLWGDNNVCITAAGAGTSAPVQCVINVYLPDKLVSEYNPGG